MSNLSCGTVLYNTSFLLGHKLQNQEKDSNGNLLGWISNIGIDTTLINTEGVSVNSLALGANSKFIFEADTAPMRVGEGFLLESIMQFQP